MRITLAGIALVLCVALSTPAALAAQQTVTNADNNSQVTLELGDTLVVRLRSNPSTGYRWSVAQNNPSILAPFGRPTTEGGGLPGAPGFQVFRFRAVGAGGEALILLYQGPQRGVRATDTFRLLVVVQRGGDDKVVEVTDADNHGRVMLRTGDILEVQLSANPSTGYTWSVTQGVPFALRQVGGPVFRRGTIFPGIPLFPGIGPPGAPGYQVFRFRAVSPGGGFLRLTSQRPFQPGRPVAAWEILVLVRP